MNDMQLEFENLRVTVNDALTYLLPQPQDGSSALYQAMQYSVHAGGKRLRPLLTLATAQDLGSPLAPVLPVACAIEFIHTYSLIHDDLPAMDDDDYRRGRLTNHKVYGEAMAILAGDALLTLGFETVLSADLPSSTIVLMAHELAVSSGAMGMVGGQSADMLQVGKPLSAEILRYIHEHKTGALLTSSVRLGALAAGADEDTLQKLTEYGKFIGLAFQIMDDVLDVTGNTDLLGKSTGVDVTLGKATYPALYGIDGSLAEVERLTNRAITILQTISTAQPFERLTELAYVMGRRDH